MQRFTRYDRYIVLAEGQFFGLKEYRGKDKGNCTNLVNELCEEDLNINGIQEDIERAHRIQRNENNKTWSIIVVSIL